MTPSPPENTGFLNDLFALIGKQKTNFSNYLLILRHENAALEKGDDDKIVLYEKHETTCREEIVATAVALHNLERLLPAGPGIKARLLDEKKQLEHLRKEAVSANTLTQQRLAVKMKEVASELTVLGENLRRLAGGKTQDHNDPTFIDVYS